MHLIRATLMASCVCLAGTACAHDRIDLTFSDLISDTQPSKLVGNLVFLPGDGARKAHEPFAGTITLSETTMATEPAKFKADKVLGKNPTIFPAAILSFVTHEGDLVPITQDIQRYGSTTKGNSYWDILVQPGKVWSEPGDDGWSRASFPFALMHSIEGETHNGVATFLYKGDKISALQFQILTQTSPFYIEDYFTAVGKASATLTSRKVENEAEVKSTYAKSVVDSEKLGSWTDLEAKVGKDNIKNFDSDIDAAEIVVDGIGIDGTFYLKSCPTPAGELPYCDRQRFGVWSVTKAAANAVAMLRLAQKFGPEVFEEKLTDYITEAKDVPGWEKVTFGDMLNMASGMGYGSIEEKPYHITDPFPEAYYAWYEAPAVEAKVAALLKGAKPYPWGPGKVARYRDEDMFLIGEAMTRYIKKRGEPYATIWDLVTEEVYKPIGIHYAPINRTIETDPKDDQPLMAFGYYPTISDLVKIVKLYQNGGKFGDKQILSAEMLADIMPAEKPVGLHTGDPQRPFYRKAFWRGHIDSKNGCSFYYPTMVGWGSNFVPVFSKDVFAIRLAKNWDANAGAKRMDSLAATADNVGNLCQ
ncbi:CubicO group peptidase (beta-lactamase class C family) [Mesorhizobium soli]|uniref:serine hydrolase domain-containing protein n=1 Tax=Pseudaminobacter soli (ex Li et al. 2025) TaxID=1295366 RepID=UPI002474915A|nr:serine hydrolase domain-containing protein [Mesorhizobium soli]MDH6233178.1 CubicO group peptidase (beta-lactamase class C family) [Mesorhizobium soli]